MLWTLAETAADAAGLAAGASALLNTGATLWFFYYTNTVTLPEQQKQSRELLREKDATCALEMDKLRELFTEQLKEARGEREAILNELRANREAFERWKNEHKA
jgi:hypothetical protein